MKVILQHHHLVLQQEHQIKIKLNIIFMIIYFQQDHLHLPIRPLHKVHYVQ
jgi:hypothetical protein